MTVDQVSFQTHQSWCSGTKMDGKWCWIRIMPDPQLPSDGGLYQCESNQANILSRGYLLSCKYSKTTHADPNPLMLHGRSVDNNNNINGSDVIFPGSLSIFTALSNGSSGDVFLWKATFQSTKLSWSGPLLYPVLSRTSPALQKTQLLDVLLRQPRW